MRLAILASHPVQYYAPWFRHLAGAGLDLKVFYLWDFGTRAHHDPGFGHSFAWDIPLLDGYAHEFIPNTAPDPGTHHWAGLQNPQLLPLVRMWKPDAVLLMGYAWQSMHHFINHWDLQNAPLLLRGDSHDLARTPGLRSWLSPLVARWIFRKFDAFLSCGSANTGYFLNRGAKPAAIFFCPHAIDMDRFHATPEVKDSASILKKSWGVPEDHRVILFAGKFEDKKRPLDLLQAFQSLSPVQCSLVFVGSGELETRLRAKAGTDPRIRLIPFANQSTMPAVYAAADLFVLPSHGGHETWGLAVQEALACSVPVLVSDHVGCHADLVQNQKNGAVFTAGSVERLTVALAEALQSGQLPTWRENTRSSLTRHTYAQASEGLMLALASLP